jgi:hypothetical protein
MASEDMIPSLDELAQALERDGEQEPSARLRRAIEISARLDRLGDALIERCVADARATGLSWAHVGEQFGTSKQAAQKRYGTPGLWPGRLGESARSMMDRASAQARELGHNYVGTEHVLLVLLDRESGLAAHVLGQLGVRRELVLAELPGPCDPRPDECVAVMPRLKRALEIGGRQAERLGQSRAAPEHVLAGIMQIPDALAVEILACHGISAEDVQRALAARLGVAPDRLLARRRRRLRRAAA